MIPNTAKCSVWFQKLSLGYGDKYIMLKSIFDVGTAAEISVLTKTADVHRIRCDMTSA